MDHDNWRQSSLGVWWSDSGSEVLCCDDGSEMKHVEEQYEEPIVPAARVMEWTRWDLEWEAGGNERAACISSHKPP